MNPKLTATKNTIDGLEFTSRRRAGNSTRQIDYAIKLLFNGETVQVTDHWHFGEHKQANENLFQRIMRRLVNEHSLDFKKNILIDRNRLIIKLQFE